MNIITEYRTSLGFFCISKNEATINFNISQYIHSKELIFLSIIIFVLDTIRKNINIICYNIIYKDMELNKQTILKIDNKVKGID